MNEIGTGEARIFQFFNEIGIIDQLATNQLERAMPDGMRIAHFSVLNHFVRLGGEQSPAALASAFQVTKGAMTNTLHRLEAKHLIEIRPDPDDGRGKLVRITEQGRSAHRGAIEAAQPLLKRVLDEFGEEVFSDALPLLQKVRVFLDENR